MKVGFNLLFILFFFFSCSDKEKNDSVVETSTICDSELIDSLQKNVNDSSINFLKSINYTELNLDCEYSRLIAIIESYSQIGYLDSVDKWSLKGLTLAKTNLDSVKIIDFLIEHAYAKAKKIETDIALDLLNQALEINDNIEYKNAFKIYDVIAMSYYLKKDFPTSKKFFNISLEMMLESDNVDSTQLFKIYTKKAFYYTNEKKLDSAILATKKAITYLQKDDYKALAHAYQHLAGDLNISGNRGEAYKYFDKSMEYHKLANIPTIVLKYNLGIISKMEKKYEVAENYFFESYEEAKRLNDLNYILKDLGQLIDMHQKQGNYKKALDYFIIANNENGYYDSIHKEEQLEEFKVKYDVKLKEEKNKSLEIEKEAAQRTNRTNTFIFILIVFILLLIGGVAYLKFRQFSYKRTIEQVQLEQKLLRSQMNPHFIFNSISNIHSLILSNQNKEAAKYLSKFSKLLRLMLENSREQMVELENEVIALDNYIQLQTLRFKDQFDYIINIAPDIDSETIKIPPMLLQPFVENSIEHGIRNIEHKGFIRIDITKSDLKNTLLCIIDDNGVGIENSVGIKNPQKGKSLSTQITRERLALLSKKFNAHGELKIITKENSGGTQIKLLIPYTQYND